MTKSFGKWESFWVRQVTLVSYITSSRGDGVDVVQSTRRGLAMYGKDDDLWLWYPVKGDSLLDCRLLSRDEARTVKEIPYSQAPETQEILESLWHRGEIKPHTPGMHPELLVHFQEVVQPFIRVHAKLSNL